MPQIPVWNSNFHPHKPHNPCRRRRGGLFLLIKNLCGVPLHSFLAATQTCPVFSYLSSFPLFSFHFLCNFSFFHFLLCYFPCLTFLYFKLPVPNCVSLYLYGCIYIYLNLSFMTSPHFPSPLLSSQIIHFTIITESRPFSRGFAQKHLLLIWANIQRKLGI